MLSAVSSNCNAERLARLAVFTISQVIRQAGKGDRWKGTQIQSLPILCKFYTYINELSAQSLANVHFVIHDYIFTNQSEK